MQTLAPTCQLGSEAPAVAREAPVVDVNNGNEATQANSGWSPANAYPPVTLSRAGFRWGPKSRDTRSPPQLVEKSPAQCRLHLQHVRRRVWLRRRPSAALLAQRRARSRPGRRLQRLMRLRQSYPRARGTPASRGACY